MHGVDDHYRLFNLETALEYTGGDAILLRDLACTFTETVPETLATLHDSRDPGELRRTAHSLKGNLQLFGATEVAAEAALLESTTAERSLDGVPQLIAKLDVLVPSFCAELNTFIQAQDNECSDS